MRESKDFKLKKIGDDLDVDFNFGKLDNMMDVFGDEGGPSLESMNKEKEEKRADAVVGNFLD